MAAGHPDLLLFHDTLLMKVRLTTIDENQRIRPAIEPRKIYLLEPQWAVLVMFAASGRLAARRGGAVGGKGGDCLGVGLHGGLQGCDGLG